jgi:hypothetical protein
MTRRASRVWRIALLWQGTVLDVVTVKGSAARLAMRTGDVVHARTTAAGDLIITVGNLPVPLKAGALFELSAGHSLLATEDIPEATAGRLAGIDSTFFHATMIGAAVQACVVAALVLAPSTHLDPEAGAGSAGEYRRWLIAPGGTAPTRGAPSLNAIGRPAEEGERKDPVRTAGRPPPPHGGRRISLEQALDEMRRVLRLGHDGVDMREAVGAAAMAAAAAPALGAGVGGLSPKDPTREGAGNGLVGPGESRMAEMLRQRIKEVDQTSRQVLGQRREPPTVPVALVDIAEAHVTLPATADLDPEVKDHLMMQVRERSNGVRHCYESLGLTADPRRAGRLTLELTLRPDGRVENPVVAVDGPGLTLVGECVQRVAGLWFLGDGLVDVSKRLSFPFILQPRKSAAVHRVD